MPRPIIIDCDPGLDDAIALAMALRSPELDVKAITTSAGNQTPEKTLHNALGLLTLMQREDAVNRHFPFPGNKTQPG
ncbi:nucleoside hydrolase, partial [Serratia nevei]|uniref:nucleoside hydrolase n=1 Tax=Serratia nevei TaxID=2703794 RepID=UPI003FA7C81B